MPDLEADAANYASLGLYVLGSTSSTTNTWVKGHFSSNSYTHLHNFKGAPSSVWSAYGFSSSFDYLIVVDMDGHIRKASYGFGNVEKTVKECLGIS